MSATVGAAFFELKSNASFLEGLGWRARGGAHRHEAYNATFRFAICMLLLKVACGRVAKIRALAGTLEIENDHQREVVGEIAVQLGRVARMMTEMHTGWADRVPPRSHNALALSSFLGSRMDLLLEELAEAAEDIAETLALASSKPFAELVEHQLKELDVGAGA